MFLNGLTETEDVEYCCVINSALERLVRTELSQLMVTVGSADLRSLARLADSFSAPRLATVYSALLPLILSSSGDGLTSNNMVSSRLSVLQSYFISPLSVSPHRVKTGGSYGEAGPAIADLLSPGPARGSGEQQNFEHLQHHVGWDLNTGGRSLSSPPSGD